MDLPVVNLCGKWSLGLLCINLRMAVWAWMPQNIEGFHYRVFIDDIYLGAGSRQLPKNGMHFVADP